MKSMAKHQKRSIWNKFGSNKSLSYMKKQNKNSVTMLLMRLWENGDKPSAKPPIFLSILFHQKAIGYR